MGGDDRGVGPDSRCVSNRGLAGKGGAGSVPAAPCACPDPLGSGEQDVTIGWGYPAGTQPTTKAMEEVRAQQAQIQLAVESRRTDRDGEWTEVETHTLSLVLRAERTTPPGQGAAPGEPAAQSSPRAPSRLEKLLEGGTGMLTHWVYQERRGSATDAGAGAEGADAGTAEEMEAGESDASPPSGPGKRAEPTPAVPLGRDRWRRARQPPPRGPGEPWGWKSTTLRREAGANPLAGEPEARESFEELPAAPDQGLHELPEGRGPAMGDAATIPEDVALFRTLRQEALDAIEFFATVVLDVMPELRQACAPKLAQIRRHVERWDDLRVGAPDPSSRRPVASARADPRNTPPEGQALPGTVIEVSAEISEETARAIVSRSKGKPRRVVRVKLPPILFQLDEPRHLQQGEEVLAVPGTLTAVANELRATLFTDGEPANDRIRFEVLGYADRLGEAEHNRELSERRAQWVVSQLGATHRCGPGFAAVATARGCGDSCSPPREEPRCRVVRIRCLGV